MVRENNSNNSNSPNQNNIKSKKEEVVVTVQDTGNGISPEILPKLFTKFVTKSESGTGLGLFISKNIIEAHGGSNGATFAFTLPIID